MSTEGMQQTETIVAASDFRVAAALYKVVDVDGDFTAGQALQLGVALSQPNSGGHLTVGLNGVFKVYAGAAVTVGNPIDAVASGWMTVATSGDFPKGTALETAASGDLFRAHLNFAQRGAIA